MILFNMNCFKLEEHIIPIVRPNKDEFDNACSCAYLWLIWLLVCWVRCSVVCLFLGFSVPLFLDVLHCLFFRIDFLASLFLVLFDLLAIDFSTPLCFLLLVRYLLVSWFSSSVWIFVSWFLCLAPGILHAWFGLIVSLFLFFLTHGLPLRSANRWSFRSVGSVGFEILYYLKWFGCRRNRRNDHMCSLVPGRKRMWSFCANNFDREQKYYTT